MRRFLLLFILLSFIVISGYADRVTLNQNPFSVNVTHSTDDMTVISYSFGNFHQNQVDIGGKEYYRLTLEQEPISLEKGYPELPNIPRSIIIPDFALMEVNIIGSSFTDIEMNIAPSKGNLYRDQNPDDVPFNFSPVYEQNAFYPEEVALLREPYILRDFRGQTVQINPFQYNPVSGILRVYHTVTVEIKNIGIDSRNIRIREREGYTREFEDIYGNRFLNFSRDRYVPLEEQGRMIVIAFDSFVDATMPYVDWKNQKGIPTTIYPKSQVGTTATAIKNFIQQEYDLNDGLVFVQLVGDAAQIPTLSSGGGGSDPSYSLLAGNDSYPDIFVGRFSAETVAQLQTQIERSIHYERDISVTDTWLHNAMGVASNEGPGHGGLYDNVHMDLIRSHLLNYTYSHIDQIYAPTATSAQVTNAVNAGRGFANYVGHGSTTSWSTSGFSNTHVNALTNDYELPFIVSVACVNGNFVSTTCFAEAWLRATNNTNGSPTGAVAMYASSVNQAWNPPMSAQLEITDLLRFEQKNSIGGLFFNGSCEMIDQYGTNGASEFKNWHIFGDASLQVRSAVPEVINVSYDTTIPVHVSTLNVSTGVEDALVSLTDSENEILASGRTNLSGNINLEMTNPPSQPETLTLTITAYNKVTYIGIVEVIATDGAFVVLDNYTLDGNHTNTPQYDEVIDMTVTLNNIGVDDATDVTAVISSDDEGVTILNNTGNFGTIIASGSVTQTDVFTFQTANNIADQTLVSFSLLITSGTDSWTSELSFAVNASLLEVSDTYVFDPVPGGNNNGNLDPGESASLVFTIINSGNAASQPGIATLEVDNPLISITPDTSNLDMISPDSSINTVFYISVDSDISLGTIVNFTQTIDYGAFSEVYTKSFPVGLILEDFETGDFSSFSWEFSGTSGWIIDSENQAEGNYSARSGAISHNQSSTISVTLNVSEEEEISFYRRVSSESNYDYLRFYIDGVQQASWSGELSWSQFSFPVSAGERTFSWSYTKDGSVSNGSDCAWIDYIVFPALIPNNSPRHLEATAGNGFVNLDWQEPQDGNPDSYNIYRDDSILGNTALTTYSDTDVTNGLSYSYYVTALYSTFESEPSNTVIGEPSSFQVIWEETFSPANNGWSLQGNWSFQAGFLRLYFDPTVTNFDMSVLTPSIYIPEGIFDLAVNQLYNDYSGVDELLEIIVVHSDGEDILWDYSVTGGSFTTNDFVFSLADYTNETIQIKFRGSGTSTWNINWWNIYNVSISGTMGDPYNGVAVNPDSSSESGYGGVSVEHLIEITNTGNVSDNYSLSVSENVWDVSFWHIDRFEEYTELRVTEIEDGIVSMIDAPSRLRPEIIETGNIAAGSTIQIRVMVNIPYGAIGSDDAIVDIISQSDSDISAAVNITTISLGYDPDLPVEPRYVAEWEPMQGVLIRYPLGISYALVRELSLNTTVYTVVSETNLNTAIANYQNNNVNMDNCEFITAPTNSYWTRDYGPWSIAMDNQMGFVDFNYNRPRPYDNVFPQIFSSYVDAPYYFMDLVHTGGNMMGDGTGVAASTDLVISENSSLSVSELNQRMSGFLGIDNYYNTLVDPVPQSIRHIDTWAKFLDVDKIMIRSVDPGHSAYSQLEINADFFENQISPYGTPYQVFRVYTQNNEPYTNSLIVNDKVYVPLMGTANDASAIASYQQAMPGYDILGFTGSWMSSDALHCRTIGIADQGMLYVSHTPPLTNFSETEIAIEVTIQAFSGEALIEDELLVYWKTSADSPFAAASLEHYLDDTYVALLPGQDLGQTLYYYISASDESGRTEKRPYAGDADPFMIEINEIGAPSAPENLEIVVDNDTVYISWDAVPGATSYIVETSASPQGEFAVPADPGLFSQDGNTVLWQSAVAEQYRFFRVKSVRDLPAVRSKPNIKRDLR